MEVEIFRKKVKEAIGKYNKYRALEAKAKLISLNNIIKVKFTGPFCKTCGFYDYFEDLTFIGEKSSCERVEMKADKYLYLSN